MIVYITVLHRKHNKTTQKLSSTHHKHPLTVQVHLISSIREWSLEVGHSRSSNVTAKLLHQPLHRLRLIGLASANLVALQIVQLLKKLPLEVVPKKKKKKKKQLKVKTSKRMTTTHFLRYFSTVWLIIFGLIFAYCSSAY